MAKMAPVFLLILVILAAACTSQENKAQNTVDTARNSHALKGFALTPKSFSSADFTGFFEHLGSNSVVSWSGDWAELSGNGPKVVSGLSSQYSYVPVVEAQFFTQSTGALLRPLNGETKQSYKAGAVSFAQAYKPKYMGFGIEVNVLYEKSPAGFEEFVAFYNEVYDAVKAVSPGTKVFTVFQLEKMKGLNGGLFGGANDPSNAQWSLIGRFKADVVAFTTYPGLVYKDPSEIPDDYYSELASKTSKPIAFTEIGWSSSASIAGWESSEAEQAQFVERFFALTKSLKKEFMIWSFMYDQPVAEPFSSMGLISANGVEKQAWNAWKSE